MQHEIPQKQFNKSNQHKVHSMTKKRTAFIWNRNPNVFTVTFDQFTH